MATIYIAVNARYADDAAAEITITKKENHMKLKNIANEKFFIMDGESGKAQAYTAIHGVYPIGTLIGDTPGQYVYRLTPEIAEATKEFEAIYNDNDEQIYIHDVENAIRAFGCVIVSTREAFGKITNEIDIE